MMTLSKEGEKLIKSFEGLRLNAYRDSAGVWTIGYGSTRYHDGYTVKPGDKLASEAQADALFENTLGQYEAAVNKFVEVLLSQQQFDALVSFTYNEGTGALGKSTLLYKLNLSDYEGAASQFLVWNKITNPITGEKVVLDALVKRRKKERELFLTDFKTIT
ncbi:lysozyme [Mucilaginibacter sp.]|uniref:lysozyme n=1 Tax=Mucilaginibacter sp. TaxID=1882438 RepID=UPI00260801F1|nr:lysozyme [Mucilaginibacter sp.]MDB4926767.1 Lysozyme RrrD [Mucilaginibacter sp.]